MSGRLEMTLLINQISLEDSASCCHGEKKTLYRAVHHPSSGSALGYRSQLKKLLTHGTRQDSCEPTQQPPPPYDERWKVFYSASFVEMMRTFVGAVGLWIEPHDNIKL